jgi:hypothetical protein
MNTFCRERNKIGGSGEGSILKLSETDLAIIGTYADSTGFKGVSDDVETSSMASECLVLLTRNIHLFIFRYSHTDHQS